MHRHIQLSDRITLCHPVADVAKACTQKDMYNTLADCKPFQLVPD